MSTQGNNLHFFSQQKKKKVRVVLGKVMKRLNEDKLLHSRKCGPKTLLRDRRRYCFSCHWFQEITQYWLNCKVSASVQYAIALQTSICLKTVTEMKENCHIHLMLSYEREFLKQFLFFETATVRYLLAECLISYCKSSLL